MLNLEQIDGFKTKTTLSDMDHYIKDILEKFKDNLDDFLRWNYYSVYSLLILFNHFDFLF